MEKGLDMLCWQEGWTEDVLQAAGPARHGVLAMLTQRFCSEIIGEPRRFSSGVVQLETFWKINPVTI